MRYVFPLRFLMISLAGMLGLLLPAAAQNGRYEVRLVPAGADCGTRKGLVRVELRAPADNNAFRLGNASLRFDYDPRKLRGLVIKSEEAFSSAAPASDNNYAPQSLTVQEGTTLATASLNLFYTGNNRGATLVGTAWTRVATLEYTLVAPSGCVGFTWHTDTQFPVTGMTEVVITSTNPFAYSQQEVAASGVFGNVDACVLPATTAKLTGDTTIFVGDKARLKVVFAGQGPWSAKLSDSTALVASPDSLRYVEVSPTATTTYRLASVSGACGAGTPSGQATVTVREKPAPTLALANFTVQEICAGKPLSVAFTTTGEFGPTNSFSVQLSDSTGTQFTTIASGSASPLTAVIPANTPAQPGYRLRVTATAPATTSPLSPAFRVNRVPTASLAGQQTIEVGQTATLTLKFTQKGPWTFKLSDNTTGQASASPFDVVVKPTATTTYILREVSNACGTGTTSGSATVTVRKRRAIRVTEFATTEICAGQSVSVAFTTEGDFDAANTFSVQLSDSTGTQFTTIASGSASPIAVKIPTGTPEHGSYRLRVVSSTPAETSPLSPTFRVKGLATASLTGTQRIAPGEKARLTVHLTGTGPWSFRLSDGTQVEQTTARPYTLFVSPTATTTYSVQSVSGGCGSGTASGQATVTVADGPVAETCPPDLCVPVVLTKSRRSR